MNDLDLSQRLVAESAQRFARETAGHRMQVLNDDGLYRHLKFTNPEHGLHYFDLITWPNGLLIRGDGPNFVFSVYPTKDLLQLFRGSASHGINAGYWQEKVVAGQVKSWSEVRFRAWVVAQATAAEYRHPGAVVAVRDQILHSDVHSTEYESTARFAVAEFQHDSFRFRFPEAWDVSFDDYSWEYLWACHAILWGIGAYGAPKATAQAAAVEAVAL